MFASSLLCVKKEGWWIILGKHYYCEKKSRSKITLNFVREFLWAISGMIRREGEQYYSDANFFKITRSRYDHDITASKLHAKRSQPRANKHATIKTAHHANVDCVKGFFSLLLLFSWFSLSVPFFLFFFFNSLSLGSHDVDVKTFYFAVSYARLYRLFHAVAITRSPILSFLWRNSVYTSSWLETRQTLDEENHLPSKTKTCFRFCYFSEKPRWSVSETLTTIIEAPGVASIFLAAFQTASALLNPPRQSLSKFFNL